MLPDAVGAMVGASLGSKLTVAGVALTSGLTVGGDERQASLVGMLIQALGLAGVGWSMALACADGDSSTYATAGALCEVVGGGALVSLRSRMLLHRPHPAGPDYTCSKRH